MLPHALQWLVGVAPFAVLAALPVVVAYAVPAYRERTLRGAGVVGLGFVACALLVGAYYPIQHALAAGGVGLKIGADVA